MEAPLYQAAGGKALFVGHPLAQTLPMQADKATARERLKLAADTPVFVLLAGSQVNEINQMAPIYFRAAQLILRELPNAQFISPYPTAAVGGGTAPVPGLVRGPPTTPPSGEGRRGSSGYGDRQVSHLGPSRHQALLGSLTKLPNARK